MVAFVIITGIIALLIIIFGVLDPSLDNVVIDGKKHMIIWYNGLRGRNHIFI